MLDPLLNPHFKAAPLKFYLSNPLNKLIESLDNTELPGCTVIPDYSPSFISPTKNTDNDDIFDISIPLDNDISKATKTINQNLLNKSVVNTMESSGAYHKEIVSPPSSYVAPIIYPTPTAIQKSEKPEKTAKLHSPQCKLSKSRNEKTIHFIDTDSSALEDDNSETSITDKKVWMNFDSFVINFRSIESMMLY